MDQTKSAPGDEVSRKATVVVVAKPASYVNSIIQLLDSYEIPYKHFQTVEVFLDSKVVPEILVLCSEIVEYETLKGEIVPLCQVAKYELPNVQMFLVTKTQVDPRLRETLSRFGVVKFLTKDEVVSTSKLSLFINFYLKGKYFPIKSYEMNLREALPLDFYHFLPLNQKFLRLAKAGSVLKEDKIVSLEDVGEFYIKRDDIKEFLEYCKTSKPKGVSTITRNARAFINAFSVLYNEFVYGLEGESDSSFQQGKALFEELEKLANEMVESLSLVELNTLTEIVNLCTTHQLSLLDRAPAVASYLAVITRLFNDIDTRRVLLASMIYPLGLTMLPLDSNIELLRVSKTKNYEGVKSILMEVPDLSLGICASRKIPIDPQLRTCVIEVFHDVLQEKVKLEELPLETQLVRFAIELDKMVTKDLAKSNLDIKAAMRVLCNQRNENSLRFSAYLSSKVMNMVTSQA